MMQKPIAISRRRFLTATAAATATAFGPSMFFGSCFWGHVFGVFLGSFWGQSFLGSFRIDFLICQLEDINPKGLTLIILYPKPVYPGAFPDPI